MNIRKYVWVLVDMKTNKPVYFEDSLYVYTTKKYAEYCCKGIFKGNNSYAKSFKSYKIKKAYLEVFIES